MLIHYQAPSFLRPQTISEAMQICEMIAKSDLVPKQYCGKPNNVFIAYCFGSSLGLDIMQSVRNVCVINGIPHLYGNGLRAVVLASGECEDIEEKCTQTSATVTVTRKGKRPVVRTFTIDDAKTAGYFNRADSAWKHYPARMCLMRATNWALNDTFPDILRSIPTVEDYVPSAPIEAERPKTQLEKFINATTVTPNSEVIGNVELKVNEGAFMNGTLAMGELQTPSTTSEPAIHLMQGLVAPVGDNLSPGDISVSATDLIYDLEVLEIYDLEVLEFGEVAAPDYAEKECLLNQLVELVEKFKIPKKSWQNWLNKKHVKKFSEMTVDSLLSLIDGIKDKHK